MSEYQTSDIGSSRDGSDLIRRRMVGGHLIDRLLRPDAFQWLHFMLEQHIVHQDIAVHGGFDQCVAWTGVATEHEVFIIFLERIAEGWRHRSMVHLKGVYRHVPDIHAGAMTDLGDLDIKPFHRWSSLMSHTTLELGPPDLEKITYEFLCSSGPDDLVATRSSLVP